MKISPLKYFFLLVTGFLFLASFASAEVISFPVSKTSVQIEWNEKWFGEKSSYEYKHELARIACYFSEAAYSDVSENPEQSILYDAYRKIGVKEADIEPHYNIDYSDALWGFDQCAFSIASKKIKSSKGEQTLVFVVVRGTPLNASEWLSNLNINDTEKIQQSIHKGFARAANIVHLALISYMLRHRIDPTDSFLFMTGHSRGAAVSNLLSKLLLDDNFFKPENIYTYTFASPNVTTEDDVTSEKYGFIWNIVNAEDIVPTVPLNRGSWKFRKYGHVLAFSNDTNTNHHTYMEEYVPKINEVYMQIAEREYKPFTTGPFVPIVVTKLISYLSGDVEHYYDGASALHTRASNLMNKFFPEKNPEGESETKELEEKTEKSKAGFGSWMISYLNRRTNGLVDYVSLALADMHSNQLYLAYMLALDENQAFSDLGYSLVTIKGYEEFAVFDSEENMLARVIEGHIVYSDIKLPIILCPSLGKNVIVGYPSNLDFHIVLTDESLIPTPSLVTAEYFDAAGVLLEKDNEKRAYLSLSQLFRFDVGRAILENHKIDVKRVPYIKGVKIIKEANLRPRNNFSLITEANVNNDGKFAVGFHAGTLEIFASVMTVPWHLDFGDSGEVSFGLGNRQTLYSQIKMDNEIFAKCVWRGTEEDNFNLIPEWRTSLSLKILGRFRLFCAGVVDFKIEDFNEAAFEGDKWIAPLKEFSIGDSVTAAAGIQIGVRF